MALKIQCGWEDECEAESCLDCPRKMKFKNLDLTVAEAISVEDFAVVDLEQWKKDNPKQLELAQSVMKKLDKRIDWS